MTEWAALAEIYNPTALAEIPPRATHTNMDAAELSAHIKGRMEEFVLHLFPAAVRKGNVMHVGGLDGGKGDSLQIHVSGSRVGMWKDHANPEDRGGTPVYLWSKAKNVSFPEAVNQCKQWAGIRDDHLSVKRMTPRTFAKPDRSGITYAEPETEVMTYLTIARKIDPRVVAAHKISCKNEDRTIVFPYIDENTGAAVHFKFLDVERGPDGKKIMSSSKGTKRCLFGKQTIGPSVSEIVISEGETDSMSWQSYDIPAVSIPNGVADMEWIDVDWDWLERFVKIYISTDMDDAGREAAIKFAKRLGLHRCYIVELPHKDANECLTSGVSRDDMLKALEEAKCIELDEMRSADTYTEEVWDYFDPLKGEDGIACPWPELNFRFREGELTVLSGYSGHGKTLAINQVLLHSISQGWSVMNASLEITPARTLQIMSRIALAKSCPSSKEELVSCMSHIGQSLWFYDLVGVANADRLLEVFTYARKRHGVNMFVIDSLFKTDVSSDDWNAQRSFMAKLTNFVNTTGAHVILVAHSRKCENEDKVPSKSDIAGSQDINNAAFNCLIVWRNKAKSRKLDEAKRGNDINKIVEVEAWPDGRIRLDKQRFGTGEDKEICIHFDKVSWQYHETPATRMPYFQYKPVQT